MSQLTQGDKIITIQLLTQRTEPFHDIVDSLGYFNALGNFNIGDKELAETAALNALSLDPGHKAAPKTEQLLAVIQAGRGKYSDALGHLRNCLTYLAPGPEADLVKKQVAQLEKVVPPAAK